MPAARLASAGAVCQGGRVETSAPPRVVVVGGGIAGLAAAFFLREEPVTVTVLEGSPRLGGKLAVSPVAGVPVDEGAEALLARRPEGTGLIRAVGLAGQLAAPGTTAARIWSRGQLVPLPRRQVMGVPADLDDLARCGLLSAEGMARARQDLGLPATQRDGDVAVAALRRGPGSARRWSTGWWTRCSAGSTPAGRRSCRSRRPLPGAGGGVPPARVPRRGGGCADAAARVQRRAAGAAAEATVFTTLTGGLGRLPAAVAAASGAEVRTGAMVRELARTPGGWRLTVGSSPRAGVPGRRCRRAGRAGPARRPAARRACRAPPAARGAGRDRLREHGDRHPGLPGRGLPAAAGGQRLPGAGRGRSPGEGGHLLLGQVAAPAVRRPGHGRGPLLAGPGRARSRCCSGTTPTWPRLAAADLAAATGVRGAPADARVTRWGGGAAAVHGRPPGPGGADPGRGVGREPGLAVCGAAYDGIGIPACIATARAAARCSASAESGAG